MQMIFTQIAGETNQNTIEYKYKYSLCLLLKLRARDEALLGTQEKQVGDVNFTLSFYKIDKIQ